MNYFLLNNKLHNQPCFENHQHHHRKTNQQKNTANKRRKKKSSKNVSSNHHISRDLFQVKKTVTCQVCISIYLLFYLTSFAPLLFFFFFYFKDHRSTNDLNFLFLSLYVSFVASSAYCKTTTTFGKKTVSSTYLSYSSFIFSTTRSIRFSLFFSLSQKTKQSGSPSIRD